MSTNKINVAVLGVGNCVSALVQGVHFYRLNSEKGQKVPGLMHGLVGKYSIHDIDFTAAFDVDGRKINTKLSSAINSLPNCCFQITDEFDSSLSDPIVQEAPWFDGISDHVRTSDITDNRMYYLATETDKYIETEREDLIELFCEKLKSAKVDVLMNYLPVGSQIATEFWMEVCLRAKVAVVNCIPVFIASDTKWGRRFIDAGVPIIGDDVRSQVGASIISAVLQELFIDRGAEISMHYQDNVGGGMDFRSMLNRGRLASKKISKENVIKKQNELAGIPVKKDSIHAGPACFFPSLNDNKRAHWLIRANGFGGAPIEFTADLSVEDSPNSAGVAIDAIRYLMVAKDLKIVGPLFGSSAWTKKTPPKDMRPSDAKAECESLAKGNVPTGYTMKNGKFFHESLK